MLQYILECIAFQLVFLVIYDFFLKRETFFQWNRAYLIGTYILSLFLPWVKIEAFRAAMPEGYYVYPEYLWGTNDAVVVAAAQGPEFQLSWEQGLFFGGMLLAALIFGFKMFQIYRLRRRGNIRYYKDFTRIVIANSNIAFSFFRSIFLGDRVVAKEHKNIIEHELVHIRQKHTYDLLFFELMRIVGWFNPLVYVYQSRVSELHEFIADAQVAKSNRDEQYELLLSQAFQTQNISFINQFFTKSLIKRRIVMLQKAKSKNIFQLKYVLLIPIITTMLFYTSCQKETKEDAPDVITVWNIENLTQEEENKVFERLLDLSKNSEDWELLVQDGNSTMKFIPSKDESYISGPNNEKIKAKLAIDSKFESFQQTDESPYSILTSRYNALVMERNRLLNGSNEKNPVIVNLDQQIKSLKKWIESSKEKLSSGDIAMAEEKTTAELKMRYNQLLLERQRLLLKTEENNPVVVNLDQQIEGLRKMIEKEEK